MLWNSATQTYVSELCFASCVNDLGNALRLFYYHFVLVKIVEIDHHFQACFSIGIEDFVLPLPSCDNKTRLILYKFDLVMYHQKRNDVVQLKHVGIQVALIFLPFVCKKVEIAIRDLSFSEKRISKDVKKTISSAVSNAENNFQYDIDNLIVKKAFCGKQVIMKRFRARAKGRAAEIMKPYSNLTIILTEQKKQMEKDGTKS